MHKNLNKSIILCSNTAWSILNFRAALIRELKGLGFAVLVAAPRDHTVPELERMGVEFIHVPMQRKGLNPIEDLKLIFNLRDVYQRINPYLVIHFTIKPNIYGTIGAKLANVRSWAVTTGLGHTFRKTGILNRLVRVLYKVSFKSAELVFFLNQSDMDEFIKLRLVHPSQMRLLPGEGVNLDHFSPMPRETGSDRLTFLLVSRMLSEKGIAEFANAANLVRNKYPTVRFCLLGSVDPGNPTSISQLQIEAWVKAGSVEYLGVVSDVRQSIANCDCVVLPSYYREGIPRALLEGAAMGKPLITTDHPGCRELVQEGVTGFLCKTRNSESLAAACEKIAQLDACQLEVMGRRSRDYIASHYSDQQVLDTYATALLSTDSSLTSQISSIELETL